MGLATDIDAQPSDPDRLTRRLGEVEEEVRLLRAGAARRAGEVERHGMKELRCTVDVRAMDLVTRRAVADGIYVWSPRLKTIEVKLRDCASTYGLSTPRCAFIYGPSNAGKSKLAEHYAAQAVPFEDEDGLRIPVLFVSVPPHATPKSVATFMLEKLGDPHARRGTTATLLSRVAGLMQAMGVRLLVLDEWQHLLSQTQGMKVADWMKGLIVATRVPVLAFSIEEGLEVLKSDASKQLSRRFPTRIRLEPFAIESPEGLKELCAFLHLVDLQLPLGERSHLALPHVARAFHAASDGIVGYMMDIIRTAMERAVKQRRERISGEDLAYGFEDCVSKVLPEKWNPFVELEEWA